MKTGFTIIVALLTGALAAHLALPDNGYALINFRGYVIETSVPVLVLLLILAYLAVRTLVHVWQAPRRLGEAWARPLDNTWYIQSTERAEAIEGRLRPYIDKLEGLLIQEVQAGALLLNTALRWFRRRSVAGTDVRDTVALAA